MRVCVGVDKPENDTIKMIISKEIQTVNRKGNKRAKKNTDEKKTEK